MRLDAASIVLLVACALPVAASAGLCDENQALIDVGDDDRVASDYFDDYFIARHGDIYHIHARKRIELDFLTLYQVMDMQQHHAEFMPGYKHVEVVANPGDESLTAIRFRASFSPFTSRFTTRVESRVGERDYRQCWRQLDAADSRVIEAHKMAPKINQGYWRIVVLEDGRVDMQYYSMIDPPVAIPEFLYKRIARGSYREVFEHIIERARKLAPAD